MLGLANGLMSSAYNNWDPSNVSGGDLQIWFKNNFNVTAGAWRDQSPSGTFSAAQTTEANQAIVVDGGLDFEGSSDHHYDLANDLTIDAQEGFAIFLVVKVESYDTQNALFGTGDNNVFMELMTDRRVRVKTDQGSTSSSYQAADAITTGQKLIFTLQREDGSTGNINVYKNGVLLTPDSQVANNGGFVLNSLGTRNADRYFDGIMYEVLVYTGGDLDAESIADVHNKLKIKFSI
tara:strand:- start:557 stop:1261 length:705 start_codon:yes stop_codon:yes gene_type:complete